MEQLCPWEQAKYFIYSSNIPSLFFYSHIPAIVAALVVGFWVFYKSGKSKIGATILIISMLFSAWCVFDLVLWATNRPDVVMFFWSMQILIEPFIYLLGFYLTYLFIYNNDLSFKSKLFLVILYSPVVILLPTHYNILGVNLGDCTAAENFIAQYFTYIIELISVVLILVSIDRGYKNDLNVNRKKEILTFSSGVIVFLLAFSWGNLIGSFTGDWTLAQAGLIGMPIFVFFLGYVIVKFKTFNIKLLATQALVWGLIILIGAQFFFIKVPINFLLTGVTFIGTIIFGRLLIKSVKVEIEQKEQLAKLNIDLESLIKQRESLMHLITHKVKGSFTHSKYIFAGMIDGTFGAIPPDLKKMAEKGLESDNTGIDTVDLILNTGNMQKGLIKYDMKKVDLRDIILNSLSEKKVPAEAKGLKIENNIKGNGYFTSGDAFWLKEAVSNFIDNSIKYTKEGQIALDLEKNGDKMVFSVKDTGVGITEEDKKNLFTEGGRGRDSVKVNVDSTGYGLFTVKLIIEAHHGQVWAESEGPGKGSQFYMELPILAE